MDTFLHHEGMAKSCVLLQEAQCLLCTITGMAQSSEIYMHMHETRIINNGIMWLGPLPLTVQLLQHSIPNS